MPAFQGEGRAGRATPGDDAVTPVVGTLLILAITIVGMVGILAWGAPTIEGIQAQNAQVAIVGEFEDLRANSLELSIPDASRIPTVNVPRGELAIEQGTRILVTANEGASTCDFHVTGWSDAAPDTTVAFAGTACGGATTLEILQVLGSNTVTKSSAAPAASVTVAGVDFSQGTWLFRLTNGASTPTVYAEAWLFDTDRVSWTLPTSGGGVAAHFELGGVFSVDGTSVYLEKSPSLQENEFGSNVYSIRVRTMEDAGGTSAVSGRGSYQVFLGLVGNYARIDSPTVYRLRYDFQGGLAESWCNSLLLRNASLTGTGTYAEDGALPCEQSSADAVRSVTYTQAGSTAFSLEVIHASMRITLSA